MNIMVNNVSEIKIWFDKTNIYFSPSIGIIKSHPLDWFPRLNEASDTDKNNFKLSAFGIH